MLAKMDLKAAKAGQTVHLSWINTLCHPEVLEWFGLTELNVPTVVFYKPHAGKFTDLVGTFN
jgi:hypothetical protein